MKKLLLLLIIGNCSLITVQAQWVDQIAGTNTSLYEVFFPSPDTGYISGEVAFLKTTNGGSTWNLMSIVPGGDCLSFTSNNTGFCNSYLDSIYKTTDGANTWHGVLYKSQVNFQTYFIHPDTGYAIGCGITGDSIYVYKTTNNGSSWSLVHSEMNPVGSPIIYKIHFINNDVGFIIYDGGFIYRTSDGGISWSLVYSDSFWPVLEDMQFPTSATGYVVGEKILKTQDVGLTWTELTTPVTSDLLRSVFFTSADSGFAVGGNGMSTGCIIETNDGGANWTLSLSANKTFISVYFPVSDIGYTCGTNGKIMKYNTPVSNNELSIFNNFLSCYPNPSTGKFTLNYSTLQPVIYIYNSLGKLVYKKEKAAKGSEVIDLSAYSNGIYFIKVQSEEKIFTKKVIVE